MRATGGAITIVNDKVIHTFLSSGNFIPNGSAYVGYLVVVGVSKNIMSMVWDGTDYIASGAAYA